MAQKTTTINQLNKPKSPQGKRTITHKHKLTKNTNTNISNKPSNTITQSPNPKLINKHKTTNNKQ